jgi:hypothetical protein
MGRARTWATRRHGRLPRRACTARHTSPLCHRAAARQALYADGAANLPHVGPTYSTGARGWHRRAGNGLPPPLRLGVITTAARRAGVLSAADGGCAARVARAESLTRGTLDSIQPGEFVDPDVYARATVRFLAGVCASMVGMPPVAFDRFYTNASLRPADGARVVTSAAALSVARASHVRAFHTLRQRRHVGASSLSPSRMPRRPPPHPPTASLRRRQLPPSRAASAPGAPSESVVTSAAAVVEALCWRDTSAPAASCAVCDKPCAPGS